MKLFKRKNRRRTPRRNISRVYVPQRNTRRRRAEKTKSPLKLAKELAANFQPTYWRKHARLFWSLFIVSILVALYIFVFYSKFFQVEEVIIVRHNLGLNREMIKEEVSDVYGENIFTVDTDKIQKDLSDKFPALAYSTIKKVYPRTIEIEVDSFKDVIIMRDDLGETYSVNEIGMISSISVQNYDLPLISIYNSQKLKEYEEEKAKEEREATASEEGEVIEVNEEESVIRREFKPPSTEEEIEEESVIDSLYKIGEAVLSHEKLEDLLNAKERFEEETGLRVDTLEYYVVEREYHFVVGASYPYSIKFDIQKPFEEQIEKLNRLSEMIDLKNDPLEYIDLRVGDNKIFYKPLETE